MKKFTFLIFLVCIINLSYSQNGPGGVENTDGSSDLVLWLDATNGAVSDAIGLIDTWTDLSGYGNDISGSSTRTPWLRTSMVNTNNVAVFYYDLVYSNGYRETILSDLIIDDDNSLDLTEWDIFFVGKIYGNYSGNSYFTKENWTNENYELRSDNNGRVYTPIDFTDNTNNNRNSSSWKAPTSYSILNYSYNTSDGREVYKNYSQIINDNTSKTPKTNNNDLEIGFFYGEMTEMIVFNRKLTSSERFIVTNYLAARYDISLNNNDLYSQDDNGNGDHDFDVAGIGRISSSNIHTDSRGSGIVHINNPQNLDNNEFLFWGHDNSESYAHEFTDVPAGVQARFSREWKVNEVNTSGNSIDVGAIDIAFDLSDHGSITTTDLCLLIDTDLDGNFNDETPIFGATNLGNDIYAFSARNEFVNNTIFTIGTSNKSQTPLPVDYISFDVENIDNDYVSIYWSTATETNSDYFEVEKSYDLDFWETVNTVTAAGNSNSIINYEVEDYNLNNSTIYYRLKQVDFDGAYEYTDIKTVSINNNDIAGVLAFPNPFDNILNLTISYKDINSLRIYNDIGQDVSSSVQIESNNNNEISLDFTLLNSGVYFISIAGSEKTIKVQKK